VLIYVECIKFVKQKKTPQMVKMVYVRANGCMCYVGWKEKPSADWM